jgi:hypothetical protein
MKIIAADEKFCFSYSALLEQVVRCYTAQIEAEGPGVVEKVREVEVEWWNELQPKGCLIISKVFFQFQVQSVFGSNFETNSNSNKFYLTLNSRAPKK